MIILMPAHHKRFCCCDNQFTTMRARIYFLCCFVGLYPHLSLGKPMSGEFKDNISLGEKTNGTCQIIGFYNGSTVTISVKVPKAEKKNAVVHLCASVYKIKCANVDNEYPQCSGFGDLVTSTCGNINISLTSMKWLFNTAHPETTATPLNFTASPRNSINTTNHTTEREPITTEKPRPANIPHPHYTIVNGSAMYIVEVSGRVVNGSKNISAVHLNLEFKMKNPHGFLSAVDYPALVFYGIMTAVYAVYATVWIVLMGCAYKDLVRLQFWVLAVILLGFLEKTFFVSEYSSLNAGESTSSSELFLIAEVVSAAKRALSRMLLVIVSLGFGTVKPRLGDSLGKVVVAGVAYFVLALIDGVVRARMDTFYSGDTSVLVTLVLLVLLDALILYWIFSSIVATRMALRLRKNYIKLSMYNHFAYALIFGIVASLAFLIWTFVELNFPPDSCLDDWKEVWLRDCFWHILFAFILLIIMIIWRPSSNRSRFSYSLVNDEDNEEEPEQGENKNFETLKMRTVSKQGSTSEPPPVSSSQVEDDLRWVEENLPTTALDKALPLLLDSDEEVMTTKFEISKMN